MLFCHCGVGTRARRLVCGGGLQGVDDDHAADLAAGDLDQTTRRHVQIGEAVRVGDVGEGTVQAIRPAVVAAHQRVRAPETIGECHAAMTARVAKHPGPAIAVAHSE
jgi:hypothetical protein